MIEIIITLLGTDLGKMIAGVLAALAALAGFRIKSVRDGRAQERARQVESGRIAEQERIKTDDEVARAPDADIRGRLGRWVSDDRRP